MAETLKSFFSPSLVRRLAGTLEDAHPAFGAKEFIKQATHGLDDLELLARAKHIASALAAHLPQEYPQAVAILLRSLGPEHTSDELVGVGMGPFFYMPHLVYVAERGLEHFELSMQAQLELTKRFTAEFSIRAYIARYPDKTFAVLEQWAHHDNPHVRRLVSEGTRLRLPWGTRVKWLDENPERIVALLELLKDDPSSLVRRSVANNLNDLGKVHPDVLMRIAATWLRDADTNRRALIEHALRSAVKRGEPKALQLLGYGKKPSVRVEDAKISPRVRIGQNASIAFSLRSTAKTKQDLLVDLAVHFVKARGHTARKVFKLKRITLPPREVTRLQATISLAVHTTRKPQIGVHAVDVLINGQATPLGSFTVSAASR